MSMAPLFTLTRVRFKPGPSSLHCQYYQGINMLLTIRDVEAEAETEVGKSTGHGSAKNSTASISCALL